MKRCQLKKSQDPKLHYNYELNEPSIKKLCNLARLSVSIPEKIFLVFFRHVFGFVNIPISPSAGLRLEPILTGFSHSQNLVAKSIYPLKLNLKINTDVINKGF
jgi:hypothetical protein